MQVNVLVRVVVALPRVVVLVVVVVFGIVWVSCR